MTDDELKQLLSTMHAETRRHFDVAIESVKREVQIVAEGVAMLEQKVERENESMRQEMRQGFAETQELP